MTTMRTNPRWITSLLFLSRRRVKAAGQGLRGIGNFLSLWYGPIHAISCSILFRFFSRLQ